MSLTTNLTGKLLILTVILILLPVETYAFGAGDIPDFAYLNDKAFRHGDIENVLEELVKFSGSGIGGSSLLGIASSVLHQVTGGSKFSKSDIKKVYFGNWLRDYSQAMDIAGLSKLTADTLVLVVAVLGFMTFGFSTQEFEVTADRLGVYLPVEHIDNPKGYAEKEGDARRFHPKLRPPVRSEELEIDERTGMKKYMATENHGWDTSTSFIRRTFRSCIEYGRRARGKECADLWEAYRLLGTGLHTMEDLLAHSNWCEIALRKMGHKEVFCHVGDNVVINTPNGRAPPLVTGTFGSADFLHSLLGEAGDKLSQASVTDLSAKMDNAKQSNNKIPDIGALKGIFNKFGGGDDQKLNKGEEIKQQSQAYNFNPDNIAPPEVKKQLIDILRWHDDIMREITKKIEMVPGLSNLLEEFSNSLNEYIYTVIAPYLGPILTTTIGALDEGSKAVIDNDDQYEVFNNPNAHDPSHSLLSKDHFGLILNEPAGKVAKTVVGYSVNLIVQAWSDNRNPDDVISQILEAFHHPYYATGRSAIQNKMFDEMQNWFGGLGGEGQEIIQSLTKDAVRNHRNKRKGLEDTVEPGYAGCGHTVSSKSGGGLYKASQSSGYKTGYQDGRSSQDTHGGRAGKYGQSAGYDNSSGGYAGGTRSDNVGGYGQGRPDVGSYGDSRRNENLRGYGASGYDSKKGGYGQTRDDDDAYGGSAANRRDDKSGYGVQRHDESYGSGYGSQKRDDDKSYGSQKHDDNYGSGYGSQKYGGSGFGGSHGGQKRDDGYGGGYGGQKHVEGGFGGGYGSSKVRDDNDSRGTVYGGGRTEYGRRDESDSLNKYGNKKHGKKDDDDDDRRSGYGRKSGHDNDSDDDKRQKYGQTGYSSGYGGGEKYGRDDYNSGKDRDDSDDDNRKHRKHNKSHDRDDDKNRGHGRSDYGQASHIQSGYGQSTSGYAPSYVGSGDTFGAERLNIGGKRDEEYDEDRKKQNKYNRGGYNPDYGRGY